MVSVLVRTGGRLFIIHLASGRGGGGGGGSALIRAFAGSVSVLTIV